MRKSKTIGYACGMVVTIVGLGLYSYQVRQLLAALALFSFFFLALLALGAFFIWCVCWQMAIWTHPSSRSVTALSRRVAAAYARS
ncbi:MAG: hypothetical protein ACRD5R_03740 [Candidatus Acidiferrales bacterium]